MLFVGAVACVGDGRWRPGHRLGKSRRGLGRKAAVSADVHRYGFPRTDLTVTLDGVTIKPALALGGWVAFKPMHGEVMVMGDLVLLETEINPVMAKLIENGIEITAVHNHLLRANPAPFYMHVGGHGDAVKMATAIRDRAGGKQNAAGSACRPQRRAGRRSRRRAARPDHRRQRSAEWRGVPILGAAPRTRSAKTEWLLLRQGPMGVATGINFQPTGGGKAAITGDFVLAGNEVNPVIKALRENGIEVTALHSHMLTEQPRLFFMHFWANDDAVKLAKGLRAALEKMAIAKD